MVSEMAMEDIEQMKREGLEPTPRDIIRLNALALKYERAKSKDVGMSLYQLPRVAFIDSKTWFRQPTIGHEIWFDQVANAIDTKDYQTTFAIHAYALAREPDQLCSPFDKEELKKCVEDFLKTLANFTEDQVFAALNYVQNGLHSYDCEYPPYKDDGEEDIDKDDWNECVALGTIHEAQTILYGVTVAEAKKMTRQQLNGIMRRAYLVHGFDVDAKGGLELGGYYKTLDDIRQRLEKDKEVK